MYGVETKEDSIQMGKEIQELKKHIGGFEPYQKTTSSVDTLISLPKNVYIIQNKGLAEPCKVKK